MTYQFEQIGELTREYSVPVAQEALDERIREATREMATAAHVKGFRKGKTPRSVISQRYGSSIQQDVLQKIVNERCNDIISEDGLRASWVGKPFLVESDDESAYTFRVRVESMPQVEIGDLSQLQLKKPIVSLTDFDVENLILRAREACIDWYEIKGEEISAQAGDRVTIEYAYDVPPEPPEGKNREVSSADEGERISLEIVLRSPRNDAAKNLHAKLLGKKLGDELVVLSEELINEKGDEAPEEPSAVTAIVKKIETGELPQLNQEFLIDSRFRSILNLNAFLENVDELAPTIRKANEEYIESGAYSLLRMRATSALAKQSVSLIPRETLRQRFIESFEESRETREYQYIANLAFDSVIEGIPLDRKSLFPSTAHEHEHDDGHDHEHHHEHDHEALSSPAETSVDEHAAETPVPGDENLESLRFIERLMSQRLQSAIRNVVLSLTQQAVINQRNLEPDQDWIGQRIKTGIDQARRSFDSKRVQEYTDYAYSEQHYQSLVAQNLSEQTAKMIIDEATVEDEAIPFESFEVRFQEDMTEDLRPFFKVEAKLPDPVIGTRPDAPSRTQIDDHAAGGEVEVAAGDGVSPGDGEALPDEALNLKDSISLDESGQTMKPSFLQKLFSKKNPPEE